VARDRAVREIAPRDLLVGVAAVAGPGAHVDRGDLHAEVGRRLASWAVGAATTRRRADGTGRVVRYAPGA